MGIEESRADRPFFRTLCLRGAADFGVTTEVLGINKKIIKFTFLLGHMDASTGMMRYLQNHI